MRLLLTILLLTTGLDLPIPPPRLGPPKNEPPIPEAPEEDPRDTPPPVFYGEEIECESDTIYYVLDMSGSMQSQTTTRPYVDPDGKITTGNRWERAKAEAIKSIRGLADSFRFGILVYNCGTDAWSAELREATRANKEAAEAWIRRHYWADGMTGTGPATSLALRLRTSAVVLLTDGEPNCGANGLQGHRLMISQNNVERAPITVFGIDARGEWRAFCQSVAADSGGRYIDVP